MDDRSKVNFDRLPGILTVDPGMDVPG